MSIWRSAPTVEQLNARANQGMAGFLGIRYTEVGDDFLRATMPVNERTHQPYGLLHGGASVALAETLGSVASMLCIDLKQNLCVGQEINANHLRGVSSGTGHRDRAPVPPRRPQPRVAHRDPRRARAAGVRLAADHGDHRAAPQELTCREARDVHSQSHERRGPRR